MTTQIGKSLSYEFSFIIIPFVRVMLHCLRVMLVLSNYFNAYRRIETTSKSAYVEIQIFRF
jgi:hypothetical protein